MTDMKKLIIPVILLMSIILLSSTPNADSQQFKSITSYTTTTYSSYSTSTSTITTSGQFVTTTDASLSPPLSGYNCTYSPVIIMYVAEAISPDNQKLHFSFSSTRGVGFILFASMSDELSWGKSGGGCDVEKATNAVVKQQNVSSYSYDWAPQIMGSPVLVFVYAPRGAVGNADVSLSYELLYLKRVAPQVTATRMVTDTWIYYTTSEASLLEANYLWLALFALAVVLVAIFLVLRIRPRKQLSSRRRGTRKR
jgi:hypothetical protein